MQIRRLDTPATDASRIQEQLWLLGQPSLSDYVDFVRDHVAGGETIPRHLIVDLWRTANDHYAKLERKEAGLADEAEILDLPAAMQPAADALAQQDYYRETFDRVPTEIALIQLDRIVASQRHVTLPFVRNLAAQLSSQPQGADLFAFCQPVQRRDAPVEIRRIAEDRFAFMSDSSDMRFHEAALLSPGQISGHSSFGPVSGAVGLFVGLGSNFLSVVRWEDRMVLHNGYHRAAALLMAGYTHVPAIIQTVTRRDELELVASSTVADDPAFYFRAARPPLLKDFFDPQTSIVLPVKKHRRMIEVSFQIRELSVEEV
ncbi:hypothetical protein FNJ84_21495 [Paracoccus sp. M683]|uniref:hypothetical protein n=1 Tax=Paracoccus sp. M683 TaxID=2594268 RepID=UPI00117F0604|nr:hypothetical protein [Paracoccus sp. M683]TRW91452.1 hypothetical protein FNJ84_21495 [Paracoccus sp. M683]